MGFVFVLLWIIDTVVPKCWFNKDERPHSIKKKKKNIKGPLICKSTHKELNYLLEWGDRG